MILPTYLSNIIENNEYIFIGIVGAILENSILLTIAGANCKSVYSLIFIGLLLTIISFIIDMSILFLIKYTWKKINPKDYEMPKFWKKIGIFVMLFYRFIPFARVPSLIIVIKNDVKQIVFLNLIGSFFSNFCFLFIGFYFIKN